MTDDMHQRKEIDLPAGRIRYREAGAGEPVVFVHGCISSTVASGTVSSTGSPTASAASRRTGRWARSRSR